MIEFVIKLPVLSVDVIDLIPSACVEKIPYGPKGSPDQSETTIKEPKAGLVNQVQAKHCGIFSYEPEHTTHVMKLIKTTEFKKVYWLHLLNLIFRV